jgi:hypothetical protein
MAWMRPVLLVFCAIAAALLAMVVPVKPFYQPMIAVPVFVLLARLLNVGSYTATLAFALLLSLVPIIIFAIVGAAYSDIPLYEMLYRSIISISGLPALVAFFLVPVAIGIATYAGRRWLYP